MSKRLNRKFGISRRSGLAIWGSTKDAYNKKNYPPGSHGIKGYKKKTEYGNQLVTKQNLRCYYGNLREAQFKKTFLKAKNIKGDTGENFVVLLESRLDAFVYRCKFAPTIFTARQLVSHKHITVNKKIINIPSYTLKIHDIIEIKTVSEKIASVSMGEDKNKKIPEYIKIYKTTKAQYIQKPTLSTILYPNKFYPNKIVEFYSR